MAERKSAVEVAVVGVGHMGAKHARTYRDISGAQLVAVVDIDSLRGITVGAECACKAYTEVPQLLDRHPNLQAVSIAVPTSKHAEVALPLIEMGIACLIEKPIAHSLDSAYTIRDAAESSGTIVQVGHIERFNRAIVAIALLAIEPILIKAERISRMPFRSLDVDVVMDLMIHDLDLALMFSRARADQVIVEAHGISLNGHPEHIANARLIFPNGGLGDLTASRIALKDERKLRIFTRDSYITVDYIKNRATLIKERDFVHGLEIAEKKARNGRRVSDRQFRKIINAQQLVGDNPEDSPLHAQLQSFMTSVREGRPPMVDLQAGIEALLLASRVVSAMRTSSRQLK
jgi:predicted dehydrogenase